MGDMNIWTARKVVYVLRAVQLSNLHQGLDEPAPL